VALKGMAEHLAAGAPLPAAAEAASSEYTLELLDLRVAPQHMQQQPGAAGVAPGSQGNRQQRR
jgi:hypothetical protein